MTLGYKIALIPRQRPFMERALSRALGLRCSLIFLCLAFIFGLMVPQSQGAPSASKSWATFGTDPKLDEPNLERVDLAQEVPPTPDKYRWTVTSRRDKNSNTMALAYEYDSFNSMGALKTVPFGTEIVPVSIKAFKKNMYYLYDAGNGSRLWISGEFLKISLK
jgi:hypothetical protein